MSERVVIAMSGGVDSSVAAALLVEQGYQVVGVMMRLWAENVISQSRIEASAGFSGQRGQPAKASSPEDYLNIYDTRHSQVTNKCCSLEAVNDARAVAERLGIPFYVINVEEPFREHVVELFLREYAAGRTPNPCLVCNRRIRFGYLLAYARALGARYLATGHYARVRRDAEGRFELWRGADRAKDQSYVLSVLGQAELAHALFPVGEYVKSQVRELAAARGLPTAARGESQDLCFVADGDYRRFLREWAPQAVQPGPIVDRAGRQLGSHSGLPFYTIGQRRGLGIAAPRPLYVLRLDVARNAVVVGTADELGRDRLTAGPVNWISGRPPAGPFEAQVQIRYRAAPATATVTPLPAGRVAVQFAEPLRDITPGQAAVFYDEECCLGGGTIEEINDAGRMV